MSIDDVRQFIMRPLYVCGYVPNMPLYGDGAHATYFGGILDKSEFILLCGDRYSQSLLSTVQKKSHSSQLMQTQALERGDIASLC